MSVYTYRIIKGFVTWWSTANCMSLSWTTMLQMWLLQWSLFHNVESRHTFNPAAKKNYKINRVCKSCSIYKHRLWIHGLWQNNCLSDCATFEDFLFFYVYFQKNWKVIRSKLYWPLTSSNLSNSNQFPFQFVCMFVPNFKNFRQGVREMMHIWMRQTNRKNNSTGHSYHWCRGITMFLLPFVSPPSFYNYLEQCF